MIHNLRTASLAAAIAVTMLSQAEAAVISTGNATFTFNNNSALFNGSGGPFILERYYGSGISTSTGTQIFGGSGGDPIVVPGSGLVATTALVNGSSVTNPLDRARQITNLNVDTNNVLGTWGGGEQIGIDFALRTTVDPGFGGGIIILGDFSLIYNLGTLTLVNNFSFAADAFTIGSPVITDLGNGFSVTGDLLVSSALSGLTGGFVPVGTNAGTFSLVAVPEPSSAALLLSAASAALLTRRRRQA